MKKNKRCPQCGRFYRNFCSFCVDDGSDYDQNEWEFDHPNLIDDSGDY